MSDLRIIRRRSAYVIMDYDDNRKQIGKPFKFRKDARSALKDLEKKEARGIVN